MKYTAEFKQSVLEQYRPRVHGSGFDALAELFNIAGGGRLVWEWYQRWDGSVESLVARHAGGKRPLLKADQQEQHVAKFVTRNNRRRQPVQVVDVVDNIQQETDTSVARRTANDYTPLYDITSKRVRPVQLGTKNGSPFALPSSSPAPHRPLYFWNQARSGLPAVQLHYWGPSHHCIKLWFRFLENVHPLVSLGGLKNFLGHAGKAFWCSRQITKSNCPTGP